MRYLLIISAVLATYLVASSPLSQESPGGGYPTADKVMRVARSDDQVKGGSKRVFGRPPEFELRKGEYMCGNKVCQLKPGEKPPCPVCQYPV